MHLVREKEKIWETREDHFGSALARNSLTILLIQNLVEFDTFENLLSNLSAALGEDFNQATGYGRNLNENNFNDILNQIRDKRTAYKNLLTTLENTYNNTQNFLIQESKTLRDQVGTLLKEKSMDIKSQEYAQKYRESQCATNQEARAAAKLRCTQLLSEIQEFKQENPQYMRMINLIAEIDRHSDVCHRYYQSQLPKDLRVNFSKHCASRYDIHRFCHGFKELLREININPTCSNGIAAINVCIRAVNVAEQRLFGDSLFFARQAAVNRPSAQSASANAVHARPAPSAENKEVKKDDRIERLLSSLLSAEGVDLSDADDLYRCIVTGEIMRHPVSAGDGWTYEEESAKEMINTQAKSHITGLRITQYLPNISMTTQIVKYLQKKMEEHEKMNIQISTLMASSGGPGLFNNTPVQKPTDAVEKPAVMPADANNNVAPPLSSSKDDTQQVSPSIAP